MTTEPEGEEDKTPKKEPITSIGPPSTGPIKEIPTIELPEIPVIREEAAKWIAIILVVGFLVLMGLPYLYLFVGTVSEVIDLIKTVSAVLSGIVGAVIGYYFRVEQRRGAEG